MATKHGTIKKTPIAAYENIRKKGIQAITLREEDELIEVKETDNTKDVLLITKNGQAIRFKETDIRMTGRSAMGVKGITLDNDDEVVAMQLNTQGEYLLIISENGLGKRTLISEFKVQNRGGKGVKCYKITDKTGHVVGCKAVRDDHQVLIITNQGIIIRVPVEGISILGRITSGVKIMNTGSSEKIKVASITKVLSSALLAEEELEEENEGDNSEAEAADNTNAEDTSEENTEE